MRVAAFGTVTLVALMIVVFGACWKHSTAWAQQGVRPRTERFTPSDQLIALTTDSGDAQQQVLLVDPKSRVMATYHINKASGEISLKSVRNINWDLMMEEFNGVSPSPREIRSLLEQR